MTGEQAAILIGQIPVQTRMWVGARDYIRDGEALRFKVHSKPYRYFEIRLNSMDTYDLRYYRIKRGSYDKIELATFEGAYHDMLGSVIEDLYAKGEAA